MALPAKKPGHEIGGLMIIAHPSGPPPMFRSKGADSAPSSAPGKPAAKPPFGKPGAADPMAMHEAAESPQHENNEEYGAKLISDIQDVGARMGLDPDESRELAAGFFDAMAKCLRGSQNEASESQPDQEPTSGGGGY